jgi:hypothetical protein
MSTSPSGIDDGPALDHAHRPQLVGHHADERLGDAPDEVLHRHGEAVDLAAPAMGLADRGGEQAGGGAHAEADERDQAAGHDHDLGPVKRVGCPS